MQQVSPRYLPNRIVDLVAYKEKGAKVSCETAFEVVPVDFQHRENPFRAHVFMCYFSGKVGEEDYHFRKCYARGCDHNLCPHVSQAVMIANRYLQRDYRLLKEAGIPLEERLFTLEDMLVKFEGYREEKEPTLTIEDYMHMAAEGTQVRVDVEPEFVPAVEHFGNYENSQTFLTVTFSVTCLGKQYSMQQCFACYTTEKAEAGRALMVRVANARLEELYGKFDKASVQYQRHFFS